MIKIKAGELDRRIILQSVAEATDSVGDPIQTWSTAATVWAKRVDMTGRERYRGDQVVASRVTMYRIRWRTGVDEKMRVVDGAKTYDITGIAENRRQGWMELTCEVINPAASDT